MTGKLPPVESAKYVLLTGNLRSLLVSVRRVVQYPTVNPEGTMPQHIANLVYHSNAKKS